ncbi:hypothetical protein [Chitinophaga sp.]|uniref:hypothetical protein n=1 Tax=Chitinophaga sp. TaxID=1869181 RepID=UPI002D7EF687|nr:hypothetical protein [Chitinophaga sp.]
MNAIPLFLFLIFANSNGRQSKPQDTTYAKVIWIRDLKECLLIGLVSTNDANDTSVVISPIGEKKPHRSKLKKIHIGQSYAFDVDGDIIIASPPKKMAVGYKDIVVWTNDEPRKFKPRLCFNCYGQYVNRIKQR